MLRGHYATIDASGRPWMYVLFFINQWSKMFKTKMYRKRKAI